MAAVSIWERSSLAELQTWSVCSQVLHVRNLPNDVTEEEIQQLCRPFGRVMRTKMSGKERTQAFVEFENTNQAINMVAYFVGNSNPPKVGARGSCCMLVATCPTVCQCSYARMHSAAPPTPAQVRNKAPYLQYSTRSSIGEGGPPAGSSHEPQGPIVLAIMDDVQVS